LPGRLLHVGPLPGLGGDQDHLGRPIPYRPRLPKWLKVADQDRSVHKGDEVRARAKAEMPSTPYNLPAIYCNNYGG